MSEIKGKPYLGAHEAITWFRSEHPLPTSRIIPMVIDAEHSIVRCEIYIDDVMVSAADVRGDGQKSLEKLETNAVRRALAFAGYGTISALANEDNEDNASDARISMITGQIEPETSRDMLSHHGGKKRVGGNRGSQQEQESPKQIQTILTQVTQKQKGTTIWYSFLTSSGHYASCFGSDIFVGAGYIAEHDWDRADKLELDPPIPATIVRNESGHYNIDLSTIPSFNPDWENFAREPDIPM
ncbi:MAG: hypothetical protein GTO60_16615 [Gammaproteobacteria bacterium]|nr:hypothetical protein [Gammaproteobacteria bacterium]